MATAAATTENAALINLAKQMDRFDNIFYTCTFLVGTPLNFFCFLYHLLACEKSNSRLIYLWITSLDSLICFISVLSAISSFSSFPSGGLLEVDWICNAYGMILQIAFQLSYFLVTVMSCTRAVALKYPLFVIRRGLILGVMVCYAIFQIGIPCIFFAAGEQFQYNNIYRACSTYYRQIIPVEFEKLAVFVHYTVCYVIPGVLTMGSAIVSCLSLQRNRGNTDPSYKRSATITIIYLTVACVLINTPFHVVFLLYFIDDGYFTNFFLALNRFAWNYSMPLNSVVNVVIYIARIKKMRQFIFEMITKVTCRSTPTRDSESQRRDRTSAPTTPKKSDGVDEVSTRV